MYSRPPPVGDRYGTSDCQSLRVHNYPEDFNENDLLSYFSTAVSISCQSNGCVFYEFCFPIINSFTKLTGLGLTSVLSDSVC